MGETEDNVDPFGLVGTSFRGTGVDYRVEKVVGAGGFGVVYRCGFGRDGRVAVKVLNLPAIRDNLPKEIRDDARQAKVHLDDVVRRFHQEAEIIQDVRRQEAQGFWGIVGVVDHGVRLQRASGEGWWPFGRPTALELPWIAFEWIPGRLLDADLTEVMEARCAPWSPRGCLTMLEPVLLALGEIHRRRHTDTDGRETREGIAHRDIKPGNLMVVRRDGTERLVLIDFGNAKRMPVGTGSKGHTVTPPELRNLTLEYGAPEQFVGNFTGPWTDVYQLGLVATAMIVGHDPYPEPSNPAMCFGHYLARSIDAIRPTPGHWGVPVGAWEEVLSHALAREPDQRFADAQALLTVLRASVDDAEAAWSAHRIGSRATVAAGQAQPPSTAEVVPAPPPASEPPPHATPLPPVAPVPVSRPAAKPPLVPVAAVHAPRVVLPAQEPEILVPPPYPSPDNARRWQAQLVTHGWHGEPLPAGMRRSTEHGVYVWDSAVGFGMEMVYVPPGEFWRGSDDGHADEKPRHRCKLTEGFYVARYPTTVVEYTRFVAATGHPAPENPGFPQDARHPVVKVSWHDAVAFCRSAELRLPTEAEWEYAARSTDGRTYPWGDEAPTDDRLRWRGGTSRESGTCPVGSHPASASPCGAQDMAGNVWEWVADVYAAGAYRHPDAAGFFARKASAWGECRVIRGGGWGNYGASGVRAANRGWNTPAIRDDVLGLRCARGGPR